MNRTAFIDYVAQAHETNPMAEDAYAYFQALLHGSVSSDKPAFTENGKLILQYMQNTNCEAATAKIISEGMGISSRTVSGAIRKLVTDEYVCKIGINPAIYGITPKGKEYQWDANENEQV